MPLDPYQQYLQFQGVYSDPLKMGVYSDPMNMGVVIPGGPTIALTAGAVASNQGGGGQKSATCFYPSVVVPGDQALLWVKRSNNDAFPTTQTPGFTSIAHQSDRVALYQRVCDGSEGGTSVNVTIPGTAINACCIIILRGLASYVEAGFAFPGAVSSGPIPIPTITPTGQPSYVLYVAHGHYNSLGSNSPGGSNPTPVLLASMDDPASLCKMYIWGGVCTSTVALGARDFANAISGTDCWTNFWGGASLSVLL